MTNKKTLKEIVCLIHLIFLVPDSRAVEYNAHGVLDLRASLTDSLQRSYLAAGQGKFGLGDGEHLSIAQAGTHISASWDNGLSMHSVVNAYANNDSGNKNKAGLTEVFLKYRNIPNTAGYRLNIKAGMFYPEISLENTAPAWASKDTLDSSTINTWIAEEIRILGSEFKITRLGRPNNHKFDISFATSIFINNDPAGALLAWHGWTISSRQTLLSEEREIPFLPARNPEGVLSDQASASKPFLELNNQVGYHMRTQWLLHNKGTVSVGYYDNRATPYKIKNGQYGWDTRFYHLGMKWRLAKSLSMRSQYLSGKTLMQNLQMQDVVNNDYASGFLALTYKWHSLLGSSNHKSTMRLERFSVTDNDGSIGDSNNEKGKALTLNHTYRLTKHWFLSGEVSIIDSKRNARRYEGQDIDLTENQFQLAARYFF